MPSLRLTDQRRPLQVQQPASAAEEHCPKMSENAKDAFQNVIHGEDSAVLCMWQVSEPDFQGSVHCVREPTEASVTQLI